MTAARDELRPVATTSFLEGPTYLPDGRLVVADMYGDRLWAWSSQHGLEVFREEAGRPLGNVATRSGFLYTCESGEIQPGGRRRVVRTELSTARQVVLADSFDGARLNSPNDLTIDSAGVVYFTDPRYSQRRADMEMDVEGVYRIGPDGLVSRILDNDTVQRPNGIAVAPDNRTLYVVDSHSRAGGHRRVVAIPLGPDGELGEPHVLVDFGAARGGDGIKVDQEGNLYVCAGILAPRSEGESSDRAPGVYVFDPEGRPLRQHLVPIDLVTNCCFGGPDGRTLYVTAGHTIYELEVDVPGLLY